MNRPIESINADLKVISVELDRLKNENNLPNAAAEKIQTNNIMIRKLKSARNKLRLELHDAQLRQQQSQYKSF